MVIVRQKNDMIHESYYWKKEVYSNFTTISKFRQRIRITEKSFVKLELSLLTGFYIIRKLDEAQKIPPDFFKRKETLECFNNTGEIVDHMNWHKIDEIYDFTARRNLDKDWRFIINQIIHSFTLVYIFDDDNRLDGIFINSDKTKKDTLFYVPIKLILSILLTVSEGSIVHSNSDRDIIGHTKEGKDIYGEMKLRSALYSYPENFDLEIIISETLRGNIYRRQ
jgi:hypothetical protein